MDILGIILISIVSILTVLVIGSFIVIGIGLSAYYQTSEARNRFKDKL